MAPAQQGETDTSSPPRSAEVGPDATPEGSLTLLLVFGRASAFIQPTGQVTSQGSPKELISKKWPQDESQSAVYEDSDPILETKQASLHLDIKGEGTLLAL